MTALKEFDASAETREQCRRACYTTLKIDATPCFIIANWKHELLYPIWYEGPETYLPQYFRCFSSSRYDVRTILLLCFQLVNNIPYFCSAASKVLNR